MSKWEFEPAKDLGLSPLDRLKSERREAGLVSYLTHAATTAALRAYMRLYHRLDVVNPEHFPTQPPFVVVANHASHMDALVIAAALPRAVRSVTYPIAAGDVFFETPQTRLFAAAMINALPMWRKKVGRHGLDDLKSRLRSGDCGYILFPEGARTRDGAPLPWKPGIGMLVAGTQIPVVPCYLDGCFEALRPETKLPRPRKVRVIVKPPMRFTDLPDDRPGWNEVSARLKAAVLEGTPHAVVQPAATAPGESA